MKFYRKTATIKAEQFDCSNEMVNRYGLIDRGGHIVDGLHVDDMCFVPTLEGQMKINIHDWVATGTNGEHWAIADDIFKKTYAELPVIPNYVAEYIDYMKSSYRDIWDAIHYPFRSNKVDKYMEDNSETFARAWLDGYQTEEDK
ncbi:DUF1642 domain-containing protein [Lactiplantibacillus plantarum]|uniref:DUF1642 domain-containing protein n=1 Tax=Lactiplantibacillus plantarum TaxID=1590 RepID=UPI0012D3BC8F|nr:DUF1642 domain-containing protein [Lactiplantibacillus plantarum]QGQ37028.1 DUF1642 domain-containing protein [Lactiplantibacillus plantarum]